MGSAASAWVTGSKICGVSTQELSRKIRLATQNGGIVSGVERRVTEVIEYHTCAHFCGTLPASCVGFAYDVSTAEKNEEHEKKMGATQSPFWAGCETIPRCPGFPRLPCAQCTTSFRSVTMALQGEFCMYRGDVAVRNLLYHSAQAASLTECLI